MLLDARSKERRLRIIEMGCGILFLAPAHPKKLGGSSQSADGLSLVDTATIPMGLLLALGVQTMQVKSVLMNWEEFQITMLGAIKEF